MTYVFALAHLAGDERRAAAGRARRRGAARRCSTTTSTAAGSTRSTSTGRPTTPTSAATATRTSCSRPPRPSPAGADGARRAARRGDRGARPALLGRTSRDAASRRSAADWSQVDPYRGANSNMHTVEAYLVAGDVTGDPVWHDRALSICERIIGIHARAHEWRIPEHYDHDWTPVPEYNVESAGRPVPAVRRDARPRLRVVAAAGPAGREPRRAAAVDRSRPPRRCSPRPSRTPPSDDTPGLAYTTDWHGEPVVARAVPLGHRRGRAGRRGAAHLHRHARSTPGSRAAGGPRSRSTSSTTPRDRGTTSCRRRWHRRRARGAASPTPTTRSTP